MTISKLSAKIISYEFAVLQRLFDYIGGKNEPNVKINMTAPVVTKVEHGDGPFCKSNFTVSFFVPFADQVLTTLPPLLQTTMLFAAAAYAYSANPACTMAVPMPGC